uniref:Trigger factor n=1 Tax=Lygus hesperus TaxID=30085 RepID=A0A0A9XGF8_LYGHE
MDEPNKPEGAEGQRKTLPPQVEKMLASAREMEAILTSKLTKIDAVSLEKSEMAKQEALKIKADVEEIKRLSLIQTYEGEEALKAKIMEVNQRIETTTRKAAELQENAVDMYKQTLDEVRQITDDLLKSLDIKEQKISKEDADLVLNRVLTFEKHAATRTATALKVLAEARNIVEMNVDCCVPDFVMKGELMLKVEYYTRLLNSLCPGTVRETAGCPAEFMLRKRKNKRPKSQ